MAKTLHELLTGRYASRAIDTRPLPDEVVDRLIEAIRLTPSCFNNQPWRYLFLLSDDAREKGKLCLSRGNVPWAGRAPLLAIGYAAPEDDCQIAETRRYYQFDLGMSAMNLLLAAAEAGLVARPMAGFSPETVRAQFAIPANAEPLVMVAIGYKADDESHVPEDKRFMDRRPRQRKPADEIVSRL